MDKIGIYFYKHKLMHFLNLGTWFQDKFKMICREIDYFDITNNFDINLILE